MRHYVSSAPCYLDGEKQGNVMRITRLKISNFRGLSNIDFDLTQDTSVIVGPNAIGKSTIFEAIRLLKVILLPSYMNEAQEVLSEMRAWSPMNNSIIVDGIIGDKTKDLLIQADLTLSAAEVSIIESQISTLANLHIRNTQGIPQNIDDLGLTQFLSSTQGQELFKKSKNEVLQQVELLKKNPKISIALSMEIAGGQIRGLNLSDQEMATVLIRALPQTHTYISYFPADRALPIGEVPLQIGTGDMAEHARSHIAQPGKKYLRLKNFMVNRHLLSEAARIETKDDFALIFKELLQGKSFEGIELSQHGLLSIKIREDSKGRTFDLDNMSSGEKGLILMFLIMRRTIAPGGIVLIDEPELHLNSSVQKKLLPFLIEHVLEPSKIQAIICTHSPEILGHAYDRDDCTLFHLRSGSDITPVLRKDKSEVFEALKRLGVNTDDVLFTQGTIYVEGEYDSDLLEVGFANRIHGFKVTQLGGRNNIEKEINRLQVEENKKALDVKQNFLFDFDRKPSGLQSSEMVKVEQWDRYCFENYLIDSNMIYDAGTELGAKNLPTRGAMKDHLKSLAFNQIKAVIAREVYRNKEPENGGLRPQEIEKLSEFTEMADVLATRIVKIKTDVSTFDKVAWAKGFDEECIALEAVKKPEWETDWEKQCDGKKLMNDLRTSIGVNTSVLEFKKKIMFHMEKNKSDNWRVIDSILAGMLE